MSLKISLDLDVKKWFNKFTNIASKINIGHLLLISLVLHMFVISIPPDGKIFDEVHYCNAAIETLNLKAANAEHMPLAKIVIAISIGIFGDYWFAWRIPIVTMCIVSLYVFYLIAKRFMTNKYALIATAFLSFDVMYFVHGSIFILDMPAILFGLLGMEMYFAKKYKWSAAAFGISFLMKELGLFFLFTIIIYHVWTHLHIRDMFKKKQEKVPYKTSLMEGTVVARSDKSKLKLNLKTFAVFSLILVLVGGGGLWIYDVVYKPSTGTTVWQQVNNTVVVNETGAPVTTITTINNVTSSTLITNPIEHIRFALTYFSGLVPAIETPDKELRQPWTWILPIGDIFNSPVYFGIVATVGDVSKKLVTWTSQISPMIEYMLVPLFIFSVIMLIRKKDVTKQGILSIAWILSAYMPWLILGLFIQRMTFNYYFIYTIPSLALGIPYMWSTIKSERIRDVCLILHLILTIVFFFMFFPVAIFR